MIESKILIVGERLQHRAFNGSNQALPWLASALHNSGFDNVVQFDMENRNNTSSRLLQETESADLIVFSGTFSVSLDRIDHNAAQLKSHLQQAGRGNVPILVGGYGATSIDRYAEHAPFIDAFSFGPGIEQVPQIAMSVKDGRFYEDLRALKIPGLSYYDRGNRRFMRSKPIPMPSADALSSIDQLYKRDYIPKIHDMDIFFDENKTPLSTFQMVTELGCPFECSFCSESGGEFDQMFLGRKVTEMHLEAVEDHFQRAKVLGYRAFTIDIETAFRDWGRMEGILEMANQYGIQSGLNTRIDTTTPDRIRRAAELGTVYTFFGVEHLNPQVLFAVDKFTQRSLKMRAAAASNYPARVENTFQWMNDAGVQSSLFLIMGLPKIDDASWERVLKGEETNVHNLTYVQTAFEDDEVVIREAFRRCKPYHFNANVLRLNPDTSMAWQPRYACIRPSGDGVIDAVWFVPRVAKQLGLSLQEFHPIYRFFEGVETDQPYSTAIDPDRAYKTASIILEEANRYGTHVYFDHAIGEARLVWGDPRNEGYRIAPLKEFEGLK